MCTGEYVIKKSSWLCLPIWSSLELPDKRRYLAESWQTAQHKNIDKMGSYSSGNHRFILTSPFWTEPISWLSSGQTWVTSPHLRHSLFFILDRNDNFVYGLYTLSFYESKFFVCLSLAYISSSPEMHFQKQEVICLLSNWSLCLAAMLSIPGIADNGGQFLPSVAVPFPLFSTKVFRIPIKPAITQE